MGEEAKFSLEDFSERDRQRFCSLPIKAQLLARACFYEKGFDAFLVWIEAYLAA